MAKIQLKSDNVNPFEGLFSIFNQFDRSGIRSVIDGHLGKRGSTSARASAYNTLAKATICDTIEGAGSPSERRQWPSRDEK